MTAAASPVVGISFSKSDIAAACALYGARVPLLPAGVDPAQLMWAVANNESIHHDSHPDRLFCDPRFEPAWYLGGGLCNPEQQQYCDLYGRDAASSFGPWQVMFWHCHGAYKPAEFVELDPCAALYLMFMQKMMPYQRPPTLEAIFQMYNCGHWEGRGGPIPDSTVQYVKRGVAWYDGSPVPR